MNRLPLLSLLVTLVFIDTIVEAEPFADEPQGCFYRVSVENSDGRKNQLLFRSIDPVSANPSYYGTPLARAFLLNRPAFIDRLIRKPSSFNDAAHTFYKLSSVTIKIENTVPAIRTYSAAKYIIVMGEVLDDSKFIRVPPEGIALEEAIARCGGFTDFANAKSKTYRLKWALTKDGKKSSLEMIGKKDVLLPGDAVLLPATNSNPLTNIVKLKQWKKITKPTTK